MKIFVTGKGGQLASEFENLKDSDSDWTFLSEEDLDITDLDLVINYFTKKKCDLIINCAAYTAVDKAEDEKKLAYEVNSVGIDNLLKACESTKAKLIHYSTDYVFDGNSDKPYNELDIPKPNSVYGASKFEGERFIIQNNNVKSIIIRTSWVYSNFGNNFVKTMLRLGNEKSELSVVSDQIGSPTFARDLAEHSLNIIYCKNYNWINGDLFHYSNKGSCSWFEFAKKIFELTQTNIKLKSLKTEDYPTKAIRPKYSLLDKRKFENTFNIKIKNWETSLFEMLELEL